ncbi:hypothetical protein BT96DRAFT_304017 [Gymnopus androsaceus JB14]|uniref:Protein kinase domain-containing protein n=1 Tax=Gymnopus androsaceus JB14 TaxID=1447944 RepID=A0A6A4H1L2_9AGAR|nr:hypothetical protein BT96DRAFT_304017 [Gymnopus androsaceus JB14]
MAMGSTIRIVANGLCYPGQSSFEGEAEEDRAMVERILRKMTVYDIEKRATAAEVVELIPDRWMRDRPGEEGIDWPVMEDAESPYLEWWQARAEALKHS